MDELEITCRMRMCFSFMISMAAKCSLVCG